MSVGIWRSDRVKKVYDACADKMDDYFYGLADGNSVKLVDRTELTYREGQHNFAWEVMDTIKNKGILLIQAGVGIGKSYGYLVPIFYTYDGVEEFKKIVISTSSIALQHQLLKDIDAISNMLGIKLNAVIAKGINNYACLKRIEHNINSGQTFDDRREILKSVLENIRKVGSSDKNDIVPVSEEVWKSIQLTSRGYCSNCAYAKECSFYKSEKEIKVSDIVITNHANLISNALNDGDFTHDADMFVIDEAHKLEENIVNVRKGDIKITNIFKCLDILYYNMDLIKPEGGLNDYSRELIKIKNNIRYLYSSIKKSAESMFNRTNRTNCAITDGDRLVFNFNGSINTNIDIVLKDMSLMINRINERLNKGQKLNAYAIKFIRTFFGILVDMKTGINSKNIYWVSFFNEESINLGYVSKDNSYITNKIFGKDIPIVCTSGTMLDKNNSYSYFASRVGIDKIGGRNIEFGDEIVSPFDYDNHALFYYDRKVAVPSNYDKYIRDLAVKISELIRVTEGKALVLFTSKKCMNDVYELISNDDFPFKIMLQSDNNINVICNEFENDINSCLFATGAFWEGIDIKGKSLSNLIVTHLPFDVVDAVNYYEASKYTYMEDKFKNVYIPNMLVKLKQAIGRLIRSVDDTGIVCCLGSRIENYLEYIGNVSPIKNITTDMKEVIDFSNACIINSNGKNIKTRK